MTRDELELFFVVINIIPRMLSIELNFYWIQNIPLISMCLWISNGRTFTALGMWLQTLTCLYQTKFSKCTMVEWGKCDSIKRRLDWDFLQALVKMNTAANTVLPGSLPFSSAVLEDRAMTGENPRQIWFIWPHLILRYSEDP